MSHHWWKGFVSVKCCRAHTIATHAGKNFGTKIYPFSFFLSFFLVCKPMITASNLCHYWLAPVGCMFKCTEKAQFPPNLGQGSTFTLVSCMLKAANLGHYRLQDCKEYTARNFGTKIYPFFFLSFFLVCQPMIKASNLGHYWLAPVGSVHNALKKIYCPAHFPQIWDKVQLFTWFHLCWKHPI